MILYFRTPGERKESRARMRDYIYRVGMHACTPMQLKQGNSETQSTTPLSTLISGPTALETTNGPFQFRGPLQDTPHFSILIE
jgi:hypothetical protein